MKKISYDDQLIRESFDSKEFDLLKKKFIQAETDLVQGTGPGNDALGWINLPEQMPSDFIDRISSVANRFRNQAKCLISIGIGGSYLGAKAGIDFLLPTYDEQREFRVFFSGTHFNSDQLTDLLSLLKDKEVVVCVISKSGTNTEPSVVFRTVRSWMEHRYGKTETSKRILAITDPEKGALLKLAKKEKYETLPIPADVGGRYSVLTSVGLFPFAFAGLNIKKIFHSAKAAKALCSGTDFENNLSGRYALVRNLLFNRGKKIETLAVMQPHLVFLAEWWKQLAGESEGKNSTGIFPSILNYTADLHSLGQWMQDGSRNVFETFLLLKATSHCLNTPHFDDNIDQFNYLSGKSMEDINNKAYKGTYLAHHDGGVPVSTITLADRTEETLGQFFYFFEKAIALSGYIFGLNPFDQPGVEAYKRNMFALLSRPNYEKERLEILERMKSLKIDL